MPGLNAGRLHRVPSGRLPVNLDAGFRRGRGRIDGRAIVAGAETPLRILGREGESLRAQLRRGGDGESHRASRRRGCHLDADLRSAGLLSSMTLDRNTEDCLGTAHLHLYPEGMVSRRTRRGRRLHTLPSRMVEDIPRADIRGRDRTGDDPPPQAKTGLGATVYVLSTVAGSVIL